MKQSLEETTLILPPFYKQSFSYLFFFYSFGILSYLSFPNYNLTPFILFIFPIFLVNWAANNKYLERTTFILLLAISFVLIGNTSMGEFQKSNLSEQEISNSEVFEAKIIEFQKKDQGWSKGIASITSFPKTREALKNPIKILFFTDEKFKGEIDDILLVNSSLSRIENKNNPGEFDMKRYWQTKGIQHICFIQFENYQLVDKQKASYFQQFIRGIQKTFNSILENHLQNGELSIAKALILGDKSLLDSETRNSFTATGAMHVLAVSGLHIGLILQLLLGVAKLFSRLISKKIAVILIVLLLWIYALITGFSPSVIRAVFMFSVLALSQLSGRTYNPINTLFFTAFVILLFQPLYLFDVGFQLSYLAMLGIFLFYKKIESWFPTKNKILRYFWQGTAIGLAAQAMTTPLTLYYFHQFPNYFILSNLGLMLFSGIILGLGVFLFLLNFIPFIGQLNGLLLFISIWLMFGFIQWVEKLPGSVAYGFTVPFSMVLILSVCIYFLLKIQITKKTWFAFGFLFFLALSNLIYTRWDNLNSKHVCIFNNNDLVFTLKKGAQIVCFYDSEVNEKHKVEFMLASYLKCYPGEINYISINKKNISTQFGSDKIKLTKTASGKLLEINGREIPFIYSNKTIFIEKNSVKMPWIEGERSLKNGSILYDL